MVVDQTTPARRARHSLPRHPVALAALLALAGAAQAQTAATSDGAITVAQAQTLPSVTVTATLSEQDARTAPASVTVIDREELDARNATDLLDAVRGEPGITLTPRQVPLDESTTPATGMMAELDAEEARRIRKALADANNIKTAAAEILGISRTTLLGKMKRLGIEG